jgi:hypothetical protein
MYLGVLAAPMVNLRQPIVQKSFKVAENCRTIDKAAIKAIALKTAVF